MLANHTRSDTFDYQVQLDYFQIWESRATPSTSGWRMLHPRFITRLSGGSLGSTEPANLCSPEIKKRSSPPVLEATEVEQLCAVVKLRPCIANVVGHFRFGAWGLPGVVKPPRRRGVIGLRLEPEPVLHAFLDLYMCSSTRPLELSSL